VTAELGWWWKTSRPGGAARSCGRRRAAGSIWLVLEDRRGRTRSFRSGRASWIDGEPVNLVAPARARARPADRTASGSVAVAGVRARVARASRILVEGRHDAELVEKVWGDDLRIEGVVVELLDGVDDLLHAVREQAPGPGRPPRHPGRPSGGRDQGVA